MIPAPECPVAGSIHSLFTPAGALFTEFFVWPFLVDGSVFSLFEVFQTRENLYCVSWTHVTSLGRL